MRTPRGPGTTLADLSTVVLTLCAVVVTGLVVRRELVQPGPAAEGPGEIREVGDWRRLASAGTLLGRADAPVKIVEFSDFQCPFCARVQPSLREIRRRYPDQVSIVYRHFPLESIHPHARTAAVAAECAGRQARFQEYHDALYSQQDSIGTKEWGVFAGEVGVADTAAFRRCMRGKEAAERVERDIRAATSIGVRGTPSMLINGRLVYGAASVEALDGWVRSAMETASRPPR